MATPHVAGVVELIKALYPQWSHAALKSAIVTSGNYLILIKCYLGELICAILPMT